MPPPPGRGSPRDRYNAGGPRYDDRRPYAEEEARRPYDNRAPAAYYHAPPPAAAAHGGYRDPPSYDDRRPRGDPYADRRVAARR